MRVGVGNTLGPTYQPVKVYIELDSEPGEDLTALKARVLNEVEKFCYAALLRLKGAEEAEKARKAGV